MAELQAVVRNLRAAAAADGAPRYESEFGLRNGCSYVPMPVEAIDRVGSEDDYVRLHAATGSYLMRGSIRQLEARLDPERFVRVHRKWLVRNGAIAELRRPRLAGPKSYCAAGRGCRWGGSVRGR